VFEPFFTTKAAGEGTGLGLAMVYACAEAHGGIARVFSPPGEGATFELCWPLVTSGEALEPSEPSPLVTGHETLLLVDDDDVALVTGRGVLETAGYTVHTALDPTEALAFLGAGGVRVDAMPHGGGREILRWVRSSARPVPVLLVTGSGERASEFDAVVTKPYTGYELTRAVRAALDAAAG
jgi:CheY-like chemotaxis protein